MILGGCHDTEGGQVILRGSCDTGGSHDTEGFR